MIGLRTHKQASLTLAEPLGLPEHMHSGIREVVSVQSDNPRKGHATALMHQVCAEADMQGMVLFLRVKPFSSGMDDEQLKKWYSKFGFVELPGDGFLMARQVQRLRVLQ